MKTPKHYMNNPQAELGEFQKPEKSLLDELMEAEGLQFEDVERIVLFDDDMPGICFTCGYTTSAVEPDMTNGYCYNCGYNGVKSLAVLMGII